MTLPRWLVDRVRRLERARARWPGPVRLIEIVVFATALPLAGRVLFAQDPLGLSHGFAWVAIGPVVLAARYGVAQGVVCAALAGLAFTATSGGAALPVSIGTLVLATLVGDATSAWRRRSLQAEAENGYLRHRLKEFSNDYHVLKLSHGQLEEFTAGQRLSLRCALQRLRPALATRDASRAAGEELMAVFAQFCSVQVAALHTLKSDNLVDPTPLAVLGGMGDLPLFDPLLRLAVQEKRLVSVKLDARAENRHEGGLLAVVPIVDARECLHAVLAIRDMHFMAFQQQNLNTLALLAGYIGDRIARSGSLDAAPAEHFLAELDSALRFVRTHAVEAVLVALRLNAHPLRERVAERLAEDIRRLDCSWRLPPTDAQDAGCSIAVLLPLVGRAGANAWLDRTAAALGEELDVSLREVIDSARCLTLRSHHDRAHCLAFIDGADDEADEALSTVRIDHVA